MTLDLIMCVDSGALSVLEVGFMISIVLQIVFHSLFQVSHPIKSILERWIYEGELQDSFHEVIIFICNLTLCAFGIMLVLWLIEL